MSAYVPFCLVFSGPWEGLGFVPVVSFTWFLQSSVSRAAPVCTCPAVGRTRARSPAPARLSAAAVTLTRCCGGAACLLLQFQLFTRFPSGETVGDVSSSTPLPFGYLDHFHVSSVVSRMKGRARPALAVGRSSDPLPPRELAPEPPSPGEEAAAPASPPLRRGRRLGWRRGGGGRGPRTQVRVLPSGGRVACVQGTGPWDPMADRADRPMSSLCWPSCGMSGDTHGNGVGFQARGREGVRELCAWSGVCIPGPGPGECPPRCAAASYCWKLVVLFTYVGSCSVYPVSPLAFSLGVVVLSRPSLDQPSLWSSGA